MTRTIIDPPVSRYSEPAEIREWIAELDRRLAVPGVDEGTRLALSSAVAEAKQWLDSQPVLNE